MTAMQTETTASQHLNCTQCAGELSPEEGQVFIQCPHCGSTVYFDRSRVVFHWYLVDTMDGTTARSALARWMAGNQTRKNLDRDAQVAPVEFCYFPVWVVKTVSDEREKILIRPAAALSATNLKDLRLPAGDLRAYAPHATSQLVNPTIPLETAIGWYSHQNVKLDTSEISLVHLPLYTYKYSYEGKQFTAIVEGATGSVFANVFPKKLETAYLGIALITGVVFFCLACLPIVGSVFIRSAFTRYALSLALALIATPFLYAGAVWVASNK